MFEAILAHSTGQAIVASTLQLAKIMAVGTVSGCIGGHLFGVALRRFWLPDFLHDVAALLTVIVVFVCSNQLAHESGLLAVTIMGIWLANMKQVDVRGILSFKESLSLLLISALFLLLASRLDLAALERIAVPALGVFLVTQFVARPLKILVSTVGSELSWAERGLLGWIAPRGIVAAAISALFALRLEETGSPGAELIVPLAFAVIIGTVVFQGLTAPWVARRLDVSSPPANGVLFVGGNDVAFALAEQLNAADVPVIIADSSWDNVSRARMAGIPTFFGNPLSERADEEIDLLPIGNLFAMSRRDDLNALACVRYRHEFGRERVFSLMSQHPDELSKQGPAPLFRGRDLFGANISHRRLSELLAEGAQFRQTHLSDDFDSRQAGTG